MLQQGSRVVGGRRRGSSEGAEAATHLDDIAERGVDEAAHYGAKALGQVLGYISQDEGQRDEGQEILRWGGGGGGRKAGGSGWRAKVEEVRKRIRGGGSTHAHAKPPRRMLSTP